MQDERKSSVAVTGGGYLKGAVAGIICSAALLYVLNISGAIIVSSSGDASLVSLLHWCHGNLGFSIIPFALIAAGYFFYLVKLLRHLGNWENASNGNSVSGRVICATEEKIDLLINIFFGIGVIWTAIGMRNALLVSLGSMDAETAARKGAFSILTQLVDGGILLSLSTTIVGGIGGYVMRMIKAWTAGPQLTAFFEKEQLNQHQGVIERLDHIAGILDKMSILEKAPVKVTER